MKKTKAVLISDVHFSLPTLKEAIQSMEMAIEKANELNVPLIVAGDLHDTKANLRGECISAILKVADMCQQRLIILIGNHCKINEKSNEHSLEFLRYTCDIINTPMVLDDLHLIPYYNNSKELVSYLKTLKTGSTIIMHQGVVGSEAGHYIQDNSAITKSDLSGFRVISGHYHRRQHFELPFGGSFDYIGNPYTLGFGEGSHPEKGFQILYDDGSLQFVPTNLRRHKIVEFLVKEGWWYTKQMTGYFDPNEIIWVKVKGTEEDLTIVNRESVAEKLGNKEFKLTIDVIKTETSIENRDLSQYDVLDELISSANTSDEQKTRLKQLWKTLNESN